MAKGRITNAQRIINKEKLRKEKEENLKKENMVQIVGD